MDFNQLLTISKEAALLAGKEIVRIYESGDFSVEAKSDSSPLTLADKASHEAIVAKLSQTGIPILSEEGKEIQFEERSKWDYFWMIDPLDGTKEFIKRNGEFTVNIALIHEGKPILGVVFTPVLNELFYAVRGEGTFKEVNGTTKKLQVNTFS
ncbi:MAG: 3'(2'),5'-bisphosphate nucleotidase CysQ, partial [Cyclobacteriaceae bacterium]|nr:3'(2'),5'-bisphosphate nucleotidase CysQ [Cyclobacteriaceae bacterium]